MPDRLLEQCLTLCRDVERLAGEVGRDRLQALGQALHEAEAKVRHVQQQLADEALSVPGAQPVIGMDPIGYITEWNEGAAALFGYSAEEAIGQHVLFLYADESEQAAELFLEAGQQIIEVTRRKKSGEVFRAGMTLSVRHDEAGHPVGMEARLTVIGDRLSPRDKSRLHARIFEDSDQGIMIVDGEERIVSVNSAFSRITGWSALEAIGGTPDLLRSGKHSADFRAEVRAAMAGAGPWHGEIIGRRKNGELFPQAVTISVIRDEAGKITHAFSIFSDITAHKEALARLQRMANYDSMTDLPNRALLSQLLSQALLAARRHDGHGAVLMLNPLRLTQINDTLGHEVGDDLLCELARRFRALLRDDDILARVDSHKFAVALLAIEKREHAGLVARKLLDALEEPIVIGGHELRVGMSIGIAVYPEDGMDTASLLRFADAAMYRAKQTGESGYVFFSPEMNQRAKERMWYESELRRGLVQNQLQLHYQPKVSLRSGRIVGAEALIRWRHPERGMIPPGVFIAVAEETGLIMEIGAWVLDEACRQIRAWRDAGLDMPPVAVNLSSRQFDAELPARVQQVLEKHGVSPEHLKLEITESLLVRGPEQVIPIMNQLVAMGLSLALDDFGTGYSSLAYLKKFPISTLKIDRAFVIGLPKEENDCAIARAIVTMGQQLRQEIVAEGVEDTEQMNFLRDLGCDQLQGYLFSPPVNAADFETMVRDGRRLELPR